MAHLSDCYSVKAISKRPDVSPKAGVAQYGNVNFADAKNKKYPLDTAAHIRAAYSYINMPKNAGKYSSDEVAQIKAKIVAAWRSKISKDGPPSADGGKSIELLLTNLQLAVKSYKSGARNSGDDLTRLNQIHDLAAQIHDSAVANGANCACNDVAEGDTDEVSSGSDNPNEDAVCAELDKKSPVKMFNYISKLHLPHDEQYFADVLAVKSVDGKDTIRGYSMIWGDPSATDVEAEFFTPQTNFWDAQLKGFTRPLTYDHAQEAHTKSSPVIGTIEAFGDDDIGRWFVAQLDRNHKYRKAVDALISQRGVGASSDSAAQYVVRKSAGKAVWLAQWPWFASALTPTPAEPRMLDVGLPYWKSAGVDFARMGAPDGALKIPEDLRLQAQLLKIKAGVK